MPPKIISVVVKPNSNRESCITMEDGTIKLSIREKPVNNSANEAVIEKISEIFKIPKSSVRIKSGLKSRNKLVVIEI